MQVQVPSNNNDTEAVMFTRSTPGCGTLAGPHLESAGFRSQKPKGYTDSPSPGLKRPGALQKPRRPLAGRVQLTRYDKHIPAYYLVSTCHMNQLSKTCISRVHVVSPALAFVHTCWCQVMVGGLYFISMHLLTQNQNNLKDKRGIYQLYTKKMSVIYH